MGYYHNRLCGNIGQAFFANSDNNDPSSVSTPTRGGDAFGNGLTRDRRFNSSGLNPVSEGLLLGLSLCLKAKATSSNPHKLGPQVCNANA
jgi:hypothetical protein